MNLSALRKLLVPIAVYFTLSSIFAFKEKNYKVAARRLIGTIACAVCYVLCIIYA